MSSKIRKRGRPSLGGGEKAKESTGGDEPQTRRKRGRPSLGNQDQEPSEVTGGSRRTSRKKGAKAASDEQEAQPEAQPEAGQRKRGREPAKSVPNEAPEELEPEPDQPVPKKKRGRPSFTAPEVQEAAPKEDRAKGKGRRSLQNLSPEDAQNKNAKSAKVKKGKRLSRAQEDEPATRDEAPLKKRGRPSLAARDEPDDTPKDGEQPSTRRRSTNPNEPPPSPPKPYLHIVPRTRRIRPSTIASKWSPLTGPSLPTIASLLQLAHAPILQRTSHTHNRRAHATVALDLITKRIARKLAKGLPFPPASVAPASRALVKNSDADGGRETELDFEAVLDARAALERQLTPGLQSVELLRRERERMEKELERDYENLRGLEARARGQARERRELLKKAHVLAPAGRTSPPDADSRSLQTRSTTPSENLFKVNHPLLIPSHN